MHQKGSCASRANQISPRGVMAGSLLHRRFVGVGRSSVLGIDAVAAEQTNVSLLGVSWLGPCCIVGGV